MHRLNRNKQFSVLQFSMCCSYVNSLSAYVFYENLYSPRLVDTKEKQNNYSFENALLHHDIIASLKQVGGLRFIHFEAGQQVTSNFILSDPRLWFVYD